MQTTRRILISTLVLVVALGFGWVSAASAGSQEYVDDLGEIEQTMQTAGILLLLWSLTVGVLVRSLTRAMLLSAGGGAILVLTLSAFLWYGYHSVHPATDASIDPALATRAVALAVLGAALGFATAAVARRFALPTAGVGAGALLLWLLAEAIGWAVPTGRFQLSTHLVAWVAGDWIIYRPPASCVGQDAATCGMYHATWQKSLPVLAVLLAAALLIGGLASRRRDEPGVAAAN
ncbi:hypothetical protein [Actinoplanes sp. DH11]|uniref:hypothetical protein n=1 Tax=Actinoplanes sp. DH11 TaxID=2857011 RepID=UPI001E5EA4C3|nr:hypothetical protein [Actinoplanes sp. DH11]